MTFRFFVLSTLALIYSIPAFSVPLSVEVRKNIVYAGDATTAEDKHRLDLYLPPGVHNFPVLVFLHGGYWSSGDRAQYPQLGELFARRGIAVVIPSYRLAPQNPFPAQAEDAAAALSWTAANIGRYQGDSSRIFVMGHSAGGHLASLLALDPRYHVRELIKGVISLSGVYDVSGPESVFGADRGSYATASPQHYIGAGAPPFLLIYAERDFPGLPEQARIFQAALEKAGDTAKLIPIPNEDHVSELFAMVRAEHPATQAILKFLR